MLPTELHESWATQKKPFYDPETMCMSAVILNREQIGEIEDKILIDK